MNLDNTLEDGTGIAALVWNFASPFGPGFCSWVRIGTHGATVLHPGV